MVEQATGDRGLDELVRELDDGPAVARTVAAALGLEEGAAGEETFWAFRRCLRWLARRRPLLLVVEDVHWGEPALLDLVDHLADGSGTRPCSSSASLGRSCSRPVPPGQGASGMR